MLGHCFLIGQRYWWSLSRAFSKNVSAAISPSDKNCLSYLLLSKVRSQSIHSLTLHNNEFFLCITKYAMWSNPTLSLTKPGLYSELFWSAFSRIWTEYVETRSIFPYSVTMPENMDQGNSAYGHFLRSVFHQAKSTVKKYWDKINIDKFNWEAFWHIRWPQIM